MSESKAVALHINDVFPPALSLSVVLEDGFIAPLRAISRNSYFKYGLCEEVFTDSDTGESTTELLIESNGDRYTVDNDFNLVGYYNLEAGEDQPLPTAEIIRARQEKTPCPNCQDEDSQTVIDSFCIYVALTTVFMSMGHSKDMCGKLLGMLLKSNNINYHNQWEVLRLFEIEVLRINAGRVRQSEKYYQKQIMKAGDNQFGVFSDNDHLEKEIPLAVFKEYRMFNPLFPADRIERLLKIHSSEEPKDVAIRDYLNFIK